MEELKTVLQIARKETDLPIITNVSLHEQGVFQNGTRLADGLKMLEELGADIVGLNCRLGPYHMLQSLEEVPLFEHAFLSAFPNGSLPRYENGRLVYESDEHYFYEAALQFRKQGVRLLGGCCGTAPKHIRAMAEAVSNLPPVTEKEVKERNVPIHVLPMKESQETPLPDIAKNRRSVIVELDPPKTLGLEKFLTGAKALKKRGLMQLRLRIIPLLHQESAMLLAQIL